MYIWKRRYEPYRMGGSLLYNIKTQVNGHPIIELGKGFKGIFVEQNGESGVYELESGGLVGDTIQDVIADINVCDDISFMQQQIESCKKELETAKEVTNEEFFSR
jgi:hypothetical protein